METDCTSLRIGGRCLKMSISRTVFYLTSALIGGLLSILTVCIGLLILAASPKHMSLHTLTGFAWVIGTLSTVCAIVGCVGYQLRNRILRLPTSRWGLVWYGLCGFITPLMAISLWTSDGFQNSLSQMFDGAVSIWMGFISIGIAMALLSTIGERFASSGWKRLVKKMN